MLSSDQGKVSPKDSLPCWMTRNEFLLRLLYRLALVSLVRSLATWCYVSFVLEFEQNVISSGFRIKCILPFEYQQNWS